MTFCVTKWVEKSPLTQKGPFRCLVGFWTHLCLSYWVWKVSLIFEKICNHNYFEIIYRIKANACNVNFISSSCPLKRGSRYWFYLCLVLSLLPVLQTIWSRLKGKNEQLLSTKTNRNKFLLEFDNVNWYAWSFHEFISKKFFSAVKLW